MARPYTINIINGTATANILSGDYTVESNTNGYDNLSIDPNTLTIDKQTGTYNFEISASGILKLHVTEEGEAGGTPITTASFIRCDSAGIEYGSVANVDENGEAILNNVPFSQTNAPLIYYKQKTSDGEHEFDSAIKNTTMTTETSTVEIQNERPLQRAINLTDANYEGLKIDVGQLTLE